jgi:hypothetical protein
VRHRIAVGLLAAVAAVTVAVQPASAAPHATPHPAPHPAPFGPQRPPEPYVPGPDNIEEGVATVVPDGGSADGVTITFDAVRYTESGEKPAAPRQFVFLFDRSVRFNTTAFPTCDRAAIEAGGTAACPPGSLVGTGRAGFYGGGEARVEVYNTRFPNGMRGVLITIPAAGTILDNYLEHVVPPYRGRYDLGLHEIIPVDDTPPEQRAVTSSFAVSFGAVHNGRSFLESRAHESRPLRLGVWSEYVTGQVTLSEVRG